MGACIENIDKIVSVGVEFEARVPSAAGIGSPSGAHVHNEFWVVGQQFVRSNTSKGPVLFVNISI